MQDEKDLQQQQEQIELPENAFRPLKEGEKYVPILRPEKNYPEVTPYSVSMGLIMAVIFSAAACQRYCSGWCHLHIASALHPATEVSRDDRQLP